MLPPILRKVGAKVVAAGGLMSYSTDLSEEIGRAAHTLLRPVRFHQDTLGERFGE